MFETKFVERRRGLLCYELDRPCLPTAWGHARPRTYIEGRNGFGLKPC